MSIGYRSGLWSHPSGVSFPRAVGSQWQTEQDQGELGDMLGAGSSRRRTLQWPDIAPFFPKRPYPCRRPPAYVTCQSHLHANTDEQTFHFCHCAGCRMESLGFDLHFPNYWLGGIFWTCLVSIPFLILWIACSCSLPISYLVVGNFLDYVLVTWLACLFLHLMISISVPNLKILIYSHALIFLWFEFFLSKNSFSTPSS